MTFSSDRNTVAFEAASTWLVPKLGAYVKIVVWALILAAIWTIALAFIARSIGLHSTPGMWTGTVGFPGVVIANWLQAHLLHRFYRPVAYTLMFLINWVFYCSVLVGITSLKRRFR